MAIPTNPTGIRVQNLNLNRQYRITWNSVSASPTISQYNVYRSEISSSGFALVSTVTVAALQYIDTTIPFTFEKLWYYKVTGSNSEGESPLEEAQPYADFDYLVFATTPSDLDYRAGLVKFIENEIPTGTIDGSNTTFYTLYNYKIGTLQVYNSNGAKLLSSAFIQQTPNSFSLNITPTVGSISVNYLTI